MKEIIIDGSRMMQVSEDPIILISLKSEPDFSTFSISEKEALLKKHFNIDSYRDFHQSHGDNIFGIDEASDSFDGFYTNRKNHAYGIKTADCIPLILWNPEKIILFGLHCGWRGLLGGIIEKALSSKSGRNVTHAFIGPHISHYHFEVQQDFIETFTSSKIDIDKFLIKKDGKNYMNLRSFCEQKLAKYNIKIINESSPCSYEKSDSLFSWRRNKEKSLRNVCLSWF
tara:strand:+ start:751 stop:1431 length:681 start_codon:yes stop_codon:yes gene_type:complete